MKKKHISRMATGFLAAALTVSAAPFAMAADGETDIGKVIYSFDFEDEADVSYFTNRGDNDTTQLSVSTDNATSGSSSMLASGRSKDWNGPAFRLDDKLEPYTEYYISAKIKGKYYTNAIFSFQYNTSDGETKYQNLVQNLNQSNYPAEDGWVTLPLTKVSFTDEQSDVYVYFEGGQDDIYIDEFVVSQVPVEEIEQDIPSLSAVFADAFKIGNAITPNNLSSKPTMDLIQKHFSGSLTAGNEMKPDAVLNQSACQAYFEETGDDTVPQVSFGAAKPFLNYCQKNNIPVRIHTLVWHSQTPDWFFKEGYDNNGDWVSPEKMTQRMENYIKAYFEELVKLYPDIDFYACDVVNEAWTDQGTPRNPGEQGSSGSSNSAWVQVYGDNSFIESAFTFARKYAPEGCKLYYNDYNEYMTDKTNKIIEMALELNEKGVLDGIGMQSHLDARNGSDAFPSVNVYKKALDKFCETGLDIQITELDVTTAEHPTAESHEQQAQYYKEIMDCIYAQKDSISAVVFWGVTDDQSWRANRDPLLFDAEYKAKPAYYSIIEGREIPDIPTTTAPPVTTLPPVTTEADTGTPVEATLLGDANTDGVIDIADATKILQAIGNADKYGLTPEQAANADCYNPGSGVTALDALAIQKYDAKVIGSLPEIVIEDEWTV
ncbi:MAG: endo-1,4-beta-xylanase [Alistipes sp.]|nr:endo-1,4-beta-xylanase [Alistipes sp.]